MMKSVNREIPLGIGDAYVPLHAHIAAFWETEDDFAAAIPFLEEGLKGTDHCVIFGYERANRKTCDFLAGRGYDPEALQGEGRLALVGAAATGAAVLDAIARTFSRMTDAGATVIRLFGNIGWLEEEWPRVDELLTFEAKVTAAARDFPCVVLCMYEASSLPALILRHGALECHPFMIHNGAVIPNGLPTTVESTQRDLQARSQMVAELERAHEALKESEGRFRYLADSLPVLIWETGPEGRLSFMNRTGLEITGKSLEQVVAEGWRQSIHPDDADRTMEQLQPALANGAPFSLEYRLRRSDGIYIRLAERGVPKLSASGVFLGYVGACFDITESSELREELQRNNELLEQRVAERTTELRGKDYLLVQQNRLAAMGELLRNIAHQWRQPLNLLALLVQEMVWTDSAGKLSEEHLQRTGKKMLATVRHMSQTIDDFRNFFNPARDRVDFRVVEIVEKAVSLLTGSLGAHQIRTEIRQRGDPVVNGHPGALSQALLNILINARDAFGAQRGEEPRILIDLFCEGEKTVLTITDNAGGIPEGIIDKIFEPYFTTKGPEKGTGIGLYMSKSIIEKSMDGTLTARNVEGGAQFRIEL